MHKTLVIGSKGLVMSVPARELRPGSQPRLERINAPRQLRRERGVVAFSFLALNVHPLSANS